MKYLDNFFTLTDILLVPKIQCTKSFSHCWKQFSADQSFTSDIESPKAQKSIFWSWCAKLIVLICKKEIWWGWMVALFSNVKKINLKNPFHISKWYRHPPNHFWTPTHVWNFAATLRKNLVVSIGLLNFKLLYQKLVWLLLENDQTQEILMFCKYCYLHRLGMVPLVNKHCWNEVTLTWQNPASKYN